MSYHAILAATAVTIDILGYFPYVRNILRNKTKPHAFSWFIWTLLTGIAFFAQIQEGAGAGAWVTLASTLACAFIAAMSYYKWGISYVTRLDWLCLGGALLGIAVWAITNNPLAAVVIVTVTDAVGFFPTFRKGYDKPYEETAITFAANSVKFAFGILALETVNPATWLYPASLVLTNGAFVVLLLARRSQIPPEKGASTIKQTFK